MIEPRFRYTEERVHRTQQIEQLEASERLLDVRDAVERRAEVYQHHIGARPDEGYHGAPPTPGRCRRGIERRLGVHAKTRAFVAPERAQRGTVEREDLVK